MQRPIPVNASTEPARIVVITRPAGTSVALTRRVRALGGVPLLLPASALRCVDDEATARMALQQALTDDVLIFTSPAAVRFAAALTPLRTTAMVLAVGQATALALRRRGVRHPLTPLRQDSEGLLDHPALLHLCGSRVSLVGAAEGRGLLREQLGARGAHLRELHVYRRVEPKLDRRHLAALERLPSSARVLWSSADALRTLRRLLPAAAWQRLAGATAVVSSERLAAAAHEAGFVHIVRAASALSSDLLDAAMGAG